MVLINAAYALIADGYARDVQEALEIARDGLNSGRALQKLEQIIHTSSTL
jgi:anthranilate phosphoribosyltransferase